MSSDTLPNGLKRQDTRDVNDGPAQRSYDNVTILDAFIGSGGGVTNPMTADLDLGGYKFVETADKFQMEGSQSANAVGTNSLDLQVERTAATQVASGAESYAAGLRNTASGYNSVSVGYMNTASADNGVCFGRSNTTSGNYGSMTAGSSNTASGFASNAIGTTNNASGITRASAFGYSNQASGDQSSAFGYSNLSSGDASVAMGMFNTSSGAGSAAIGYANTSSGNFSSAIGKGNTSSGQYSSAFGYQNTSSTLNSQVFGRRNFSGVGNGIVAVGLMNNETGGTFNTSTGAITGSSSAQNAGSGSVAFGRENLASGSQSVAIGINNTASNLRTSAVGYQNSVGNSECHAFGGFNNGASAGSYTTLIGYGNTASNYYGNGLLAGLNNTASGYFGVTTVGMNNTGSGYYTSTFGYACTNNAQYSTVSGYQAYAGSNQFVSAFGRNVRVEGNNASVFGHFAKTTVANTIEAGYWSNSLTRGGAVRMHPNGQVAFTVADSATDPTDGGTTAGSEANTTLPRGMLAFQLNGTDLHIFYNNAGTIVSKNLGNLT